MNRPGIRPLRNALQRPAVLGPTGLPARRTRRRIRATSPARPSPFLSSLVGVDAGCALLATVAGLVSPFAPSPSVPITVSAPLIWVAALLAAGSYAGAVEEGLDELRRILVAAGLVLAGVALLGWGFGVDVPRGFVALTLPLAALLTYAVRTVRRRVVVHAPSRSRPARTVLLVGDRQAAEELRGQFVRGPGGHRVVGYCLSTVRGVASPLPGLPALGGLTDVAEVARRYQVDTVVVVPSADLDSAGLEQLNRQVAASGADLLLASPVTDIIAARRASIRSLAGVRLIHLHRPRPTGKRDKTGSIWDRVVAGLLIVLIAPVLAATAVAVALGSRGPVLVRERRVGPDGKVSGMLRFRVEVSGSEEALTRVGSLLRRGHLDQLPRLVDVLRGDLPLSRCLPDRRPTARRSGEDI